MTPTRTLVDWRAFPSWADDKIFCTHWATEATDAGEPSGAIVRCSKPAGHKGSHRSEWTA